jgi:hypothetical protein
VQPVATRPSTRLEDNIVRPKVFIDGIVWYDHRGLSMV